MIALVAAQVVERSPNSGGISPMAAELAGRGKPRQLPTAPAVAEDAPAAGAEEAEVAKFKVRCRPTRVSRRVASNSRG